MNKGISYLKEEEEEEDQVKNYDFCSDDDGDDDANISIAVSRYGHLSGQSGDGNNLKKEKDGGKHGTKQIHGCTLGSCRFVAFKC